MLRFTETIQEKREISIKYQSRRIELKDRERGRGSKEKPKSTAPFFGGREGEGDKEDRKREEGTLHTQDTVVTDEHISAHKHAQRDSGGEEE